MEDEGWQIVSQAGSRKLQLGLIAGVMTDKSMTVSRSLGRPLYRRESWRGRGSSWLHTQI